MNFIKLIELDRNDDHYLYMQLYNKIKQMIIDGKLKPHYKLPPIRKMASELEVNNVTVVNAYKLLEQDGYVYKRVGSGTYVENISDRDSKEVIFDDEIGIYDDTISKPSKWHIEVKSNTINFASGTPTPDLFPVDDFKSVLNEVLDRDKGNAFGYQESQGYYPLRESIRDYVISYGINTNVDNIQIISGAQQGIDIISKALIDYGDIVFTESPTYTGAIAAFNSRSARIIEIPIEKDGINLNNLENKLRTFSPKFIYIMSNYQNPTGFSYSKQKKEALLKLADEYDFYIIEDDYLSDLSFFNEDSLSIKALDKRDKVIYIKSFSKIFMPGLRLGFMIIPFAIYKDVLAAKHTSDISTSGLIQRAFDLYIRKGIWQQHIQYMGKIYLERYNIMTRCIEKHIPPEIFIDVPSGGLNFWFSLPQGYSSNDLFKFCNKKNIILVPGTLFYVDQRDSNKFRLSIASVYAKDLEPSMMALSNEISLFLKNYDPKKFNDLSYSPLL